MTYNLNYKRIEHEHKIFHHSRQSTNKQQKYKGEKILEYKNVTLGLERRDKDLNPGKERSQLIRAAARQDRNSIAPDYCKRNPLEEPF